MNWRDIFGPFFIALVIVAGLFLLVSLVGDGFVDRAPTCTQVQKDYMRAAMSEDVIGVPEALHEAQGCRP